MAAAVWGRRIAGGHRSHESADRKTGIGELISGCSSGYGIRSTTSTRSREWKTEGHCSHRKSSSGELWVCLSCCKWASSCSCSRVSGRAEVMRPCLSCSKIKGSSSIHRRAVAVYRMKMAAVVCRRKKTRASATIYRMKKKAVVCCTRVAVSTAVLVLSKSCYSSEHHHGRIAMGCYSLTGEEHCGTTRRWRAGKLPAWRQPSWLRSLRSISS